MQSRPKAFYTHTWGDQNDLLKGIDMVKIACFCSKDSQIFYKTTKILNCRHNVEVVSNIVYKGHAFHFYNAALAGDV